MMDLYGLFVENVFGGFWVAIMGLALIILIILILGNVSFYSALWFVGFFILAMAIGYGTTILTVSITAAVIINFIFQWMKYIDR